MRQTRIVGDRHPGIGTQWLAHIEQQATAAAQEFARLARELGLPAEHALDLVRAALDGAQRA